ncbi:hypothetical protein SAMN05660461_4439 [Chitinophaga ginsengisegetis]|uniref:CHRD domain-containing protein n=1 Tax=Chitinophaga ginsengisegetis TaxID=393003 RepID=A0A1T5P7H8_9BACT|nr:hypothetical protein [Chitinophaga ginsengisegetis]MDR6565999.1 hypothetical protein [Chitinophaga ginsengisegetis]MDR6645728.1 hypothetical protein [Chitinophaga ginsengisegetis]MDR6651680.1 hypothetical protein [Chitinophaga ginsengisegetis]SKD08567.1 hypothetical protein SAMN05660461_4439 [Chitinophaga ginsengisegetis]
MLMFNKNTLLTGVVIATVLGITVSSCKDDDNPTPPPPTPRSKSFELKGSGADKDKKVGDITITENTDSSVNVVLNLTKNIKDADHGVYLIAGTAAAPKTDTLLKGTFKGTGAALKIDLLTKVKSIKVSKPGGIQKDTAFKYNNAIELSSHLKVMKAADTIAIGLFGKSN